MEEHKNNGDILKITRSDQYRTVEELFAHAQESSAYYTLLIFSAIIVTAGLLLGNSAIVLGGVLVAPILTPLLVIGLSFSVGETGAIKTIIKLVFKSFVLVIGTSFTFALIMGNNEGVSVFDNTSRTALLYFIVALVSGVAAAFAWSRKEISEVLPGVSLAVTLVPPLSLMGIWLSAGNVEALRFYSTVLSLNFFGIVLGSIVVFSLLKFSKIDSKVKAEAEEIKN